MRKPRLVPAALLALLLLGGCVERKFLIRTEPEGATVLVNGSVAGKSPAEISFHHYGTVRLEVLPLDLDGDGWIDYRRAVRSHELSSPWYQWFPVDFFADNLLPWTLEDRHEARVVLEPALKFDVQADREEMEKSAKSLRIRAEKTRVEGEAEAPEPAK